MSSSPVDTEVAMAETTTESNSEAPQPDFDELQAQLIGAVGNLALLRNIPTIGQGGYLLQQIGSITQSINNLTETIGQLDQRIGNIEMRLENFRNWLMAA